MLSRLVEGLPNLTSLDISGTNLAGTGVYESSYLRESSEEKEGKEGLDSEPSAPLALSECDIPGLATRVKKPLDFLGLYKSAHEACCRSHIPAKKVILKGENSCKLLLQLR